MGVGKFLYSYYFSEAINFKKTEQYYEMIFYKIKRKLISTFVDKKENLNNITYLTVM